MAHQLQLFGESAPAAPAASAELLALQKAEAELAAYLQAKKPKAKPESIEKTAIAKAATHIDLPHNSPEEKLENKQDANPSNPLAARPAAQVQHEERESRTDKHSGKTEEEIQDDSAIIFEDFLADEEADDQPLATDDFTHEIHLPQAENDLDLKPIPQPPKPEENTEPAEPKKKSPGTKSLALRLEEITVPPDDELFKKQYYTAGTVAGWFQLNPAVLRQWTNTFAQLKPRKNRKGDRLYRPEDVKLLVLIYQLIKERKYSLEGARQYLTLHEDGLSAQQQIYEALTKFRSFLLALKANLGA